MKQKGKEYFCLEASSERGMVKLDYSLAFKKKIPGVFI